MSDPQPRVAILMGSDSDLPVMRGAGDILASFGIAHEVKVLSAHRSPARAVDYVTTAPSRGVRVFICGAGMAAHLAGVVAAHTALPVIGVPLKSESAGLGGADALYSTVQMPPGIPVATVAVGGAKNAGHLAARILAVSDPDLSARIERFRREMDEGVAAKNAQLDALGVDGYLASKR
ncbi:MAG: 5-(carboxyamino)imidazole ribonucleotide mutase [Caldilineae bacterium]|nr:5-(carboxyamino)imidazole ribonucleotide mutase [Caldilineae bacterium]